MTATACRWRLGPAFGLWLSSNLHEGIAAPVRIGDRTSRPGIVLPLAVHNEPVFVAARWNSQLRPPNTVDVLAQGRARGIPLIKITGDEDFARSNSIEYDFNRVWL